MEISKRGTIVILATGGTIAGIGKKGKTIGYESGQLTADEILNHIPEISSLAPIATIQVCNINSDDITYDIWFKLVSLINELSLNPFVSGFVILHVTDTMEETAYFLNLTIKTEKPVVLTGSMRPSTAISADSSLNIYEAILVAASQESVGKGVLIAFSDQVFAARSMTKASTYSVKAISGGETGSIGIIRDDEVFYYGKNLKRHTLCTEFDVSNCKDLPNVPIIYFATGQDPRILEYAVSIADGLVIAGAGAGEYSKEFLKIIDEASIPIVISSRINDGVITQSGMLSKNTIAANNLQPQKAAILLKLALTRTKVHSELVRIFSMY